MASSPRREFRLSPVSAPADTLGGQCLPWCPVSFERKSRCPRGPALTLLIDVVPLPFRVVLLVHTPPRAAQHSASHSIVSSFQVCVSPVGEQRGVTTRVTQCSGTCGMKSVKGALLVWNEFWQIDLEKEGPGLGPPGQPSRVVVETRARLAQPQGPEGARQRRMTCRRPGEVPPGVVLPRRARRTVLVSPALSGVPLVPSRMPLRP